MAKKSEDIVPRSRSPVPPRVVGSVTRPVEFSSPAPGRPRVFWIQGINPDIVREFWPSHGELPYQEGPLPPQFLGVTAGNPKMVKRYTFGTAKKLVIYERAQPEIRLVLLLDSPYDRDGETLQPIIQARVERDRGVDPQQSRTREQRLWDEVCPVERRGRPRGSGHPKRRQFLEFPVTRKDIDRLGKAGLDDKDLRILFGRLERKTFLQIGNDLGMSPQGTWKRWNRRVGPALKKLNPKFSRGSFELAALDRE
jgi:hypothetical protein